MTSKRLQYDTSRATDGTWDDTETPESIKFTALLAKSIADLRSRRPPDVVRIARQNDKAESEGEAHRQRLPLYQNPFGLVTKLLTKADKEYHDPRATQAVAEEMLKLEKAGSWEDRPFTRKSAKSYEGAAFTRLFSIVGIKHFEDAAKQVFKGRVVAMGSHVIDQTGTEVSWNEIASTPSSLQNFKHIITYR